MSDNKHDTVATDDIVCPHCGVAFYEDESPSIRYTCGECGREFRCEADYSVTYTTRCLESEHDYGDWAAAYDVSWEFRCCQRCEHMEVRPIDPRRERSRR